MGVDTQDAVKHLIDAGACTTAFCAFFHVIPWVEISAFLSALWVFFRMVEGAVKGIKYLKTKYWHK